MPRPPGQGAPREARRYDQTSLDVEGSQLVHRDYAAHYFRWGFARRFCVGQRVLDVGCGPNLPLCHVLCHHGDMGAKSEFYLGVDLNPLPHWTGKLRHTWGELDFTEEWTKVKRRYGAFDVATNFEVIEHMGVDDGARLLEAIWRCVRPGGTLLLSTPRNEGHKPARNHVHEYGTEELRETLEREGFKVLQRFGTFGDVRTLAKAALPKHREVMSELAEYYENGVLATFLAPLYPDACKNNLWVCERRRRR